MKIKNHPDFYQKGWFYYLNLNSRDIESGNFLN